MRRNSIDRYRISGLTLILFIVVFSGVAPARTVTDEIGRRVTTADVPVRIVSLAPGITETLYELGLDAQIAGVTSYCNWPPRARQKPRVGGFTNPSVEKIVSLKPDLIIATIDGNRKDTVSQLERIGLPVYVINPSDTDKILKGIMHIGEITNRTQEASKLESKLRRRLNHITAETKNKIKPRVFFQIGLEPVITAGRGTLIDEAIRRAGGINISGNDTARYPRYSAEGIMAGSPDIILFAPMANDREFTAVKTFWRQFDQVPAVKNGKIYPINTDLISRASPRFFDAIETMALIFHPEIKLK